MITSVASLPSRKSNLTSVIDAALKLLPEAAPDISVSVWNTIRMPTGGIYSIFFFHFDGGLEFE